MSETVVTLTFPAKADYLLLARLALAGLGRAVPLEPDVLADLKLAVTEACGNAVRHAYGNGGGPVTVVFVASDDKLEMTVEDQGSGLELTDFGAEMEELSELGPKEGGMGMAIIRAVVDDLEVRDGADGHGTVVHMTKYLGQPE
jgi:serine/threonine-protein kinase RsbW